MPAAPSAGPASDRPAPAGCPAPRWQPPRASCASCPALLPCQQSYPVSRKPLVVVGGGSQLRRAHPVARTPCGAHTCCGRSAAPHTAAHTVRGRVRVGEGQGWVCSLALLHAHDTCGTHPALSGRTRRGPSSRNGLANPNPNPNQDEATGGKGRPWQRTLWAVLDDPASSKTAKRGTPPG